MDSAKIPKKNLGFFPTPLIELENISNRLSGPKILMKRDDLTGLAFGGNKTRKLEYLVGDAIQKGCDTLITGGALQSNHCRQTAAAAAASGLSCHLALGGEAPQNYSGNILVDKILGAAIHWTGEFRKGEKIPEIAEQLINLGKKPYIIPYGGSNELGAVGFIEAVLELKLQLDAINKKIDAIVFASSSGGTHTGLLLGNKIYHLNAKIYGIKIDKAEYENMEYEIFLPILINRTKKLFDIDQEVTDADIILDGNYLGGGYGVIGDMEKRAIKLLAETEGILVDPVYTGRAFGAMIDLIEKKYFSKNETILFWHTGGTPSIFSYGDELI
jgi:D-cysteine desulfhydrase